MTLAAAMPSLLGVLIMVLSVYVVLDMGQRVRRLGPRDGRPWLIGAGLALATGLWASAVLGLTALLPDADVGFEPGWSVTAALLSTALCVLGLGCIHAAGSSQARHLCGAAALGLAALLTPAMLLHALGVAPAARWQLALLALVCVVASATLAVVVRVMAAKASAHDGAMPRLVAAALAGTAMVLAQQWLIAAVDLPGLPMSASDTQIGHKTMHSVAAIGGLQLLLLLLLGSRLEARIRGKLDQASQEMKANALRDGLTGLPNRNSFEGTLAQAQRLADEAHRGAALLLVALDGFKHVNDQHGHQVGDKLLRLVAQRLRALAQPHRVARLGSDEFLLLLEGENIAQRSQALAAQVIDAIALPCELDGRELAISCSIGVAHYPQHGSMSALITHAGVAMRASKSGGGATYSIFDARMVVDTREQAELLRDLRLAVSRSQMVLYYQPKIHAPSAQITGAEALLRWNHPTRGMISPTVFIPMAERSGLINKLGAWVIDEACRQARDWRDQGLRMRVAINLSAHQLRQADLPQRIADALARHKINPDLLTCEVTESVAMEDSEATAEFFAKLAGVGVHISIDDFGAGYSSLAYLRKLPANELKIDRSFVLDLENSEEARKIASAVVQLAQALNLKVVAEGVETEGQFAILRELGCNELQGYLFAKPMSAKALALWAITDIGPRSMQFRESLFKATQTVAA